MAWKTSDLFPICQDEDCPDYGKGRHPNELQQAILGSKAKVSYDQGGVGSGKTLGAVIKHLLLMVTVPGNLGLVVRESLPKLHDTTQRIYQEVLQRYEEVSGAEVRRLDNRNDFSHHLKFPNGSEVFFRPSDKVALGPEYGAILIDEAQEEPRRTFERLLERLRRPAAGRYLWLGLLSNPPKKGTWLHEIFGEEPRQFYVGEGKKSSLYEMRRSSSRHNRNLPPGYVDDLIALHGEAKALQILDGYYGFTADGKAVYAPPFLHERHVGQASLITEQPLVRSWDFGFRHPACTWHQMYKCRHKTVHWQILAEVVDKMELEAEEFAKHVTEHHTRQFPSWHRSLVADCGDRAGDKRSDTGPGAITRLGRSPFYLRFTYRHDLKIDRGIELIVRRLRSTCPCNVPVVLVDRRCTGVIETLAGGYHFPKDGPSQTPKQLPRKDGYYDDIADSVRYAAENFLRPMLSDGGYLTDYVGRQASLPQPEPWEWMIESEQGPLVVSY